MEKLKAEQEKEMALLQSKELEKAKKAAILVKEAAKIKKETV